jgi:hypothetical protein
VAPATSGRWDTFKPCETPYEPFDRFVEPFRQVQFPAGSIVGGPLANQFNPEVVATGTVLTMPWRVKLSKLCAMHQDHVTNQCNTAPQQRVISHALTCWSLICGVYDLEMMGMANGEIFS